MTGSRIHHFENPVRVVQQLLIGKSITRGLFNLAIERYELKGEVLDLGSKNGTSSYYEHIKRDKDCRVTFTDLVPGPGVIPVNVEELFPFISASFDTVIAFHLFEHVYDFWRIPGEIFRILKPGGRVIVAVPFIHEYHSDPGDYWRMSGEALCRLFQDAGFSVKSVEMVGEGIASFAATKTIAMITPRFIRGIGMTVAYVIGAGIDRLVYFARRKIAFISSAEKFALDVICEFRKY